MRFYVFRNFTVENLFGNPEFIYSGYNDILTCDYQSDVYLWLYFVPVALNRSKLKDEIKTYFQSIELIYNNVPANGTFLIFTLRDFYNIKYQNADFSVENEIDNFNRQVVQFAKERQNVKVVDISDFVCRYSVNQLVDWKFFCLSKMIINPKLATSFKSWFFEQFDKIQYKRKKCAIFDLDNTLWGGVIGEDGSNGIKIGGNYPGSAFLMFQEGLVELMNAGVILAICSKNNENDVLEVFRENPYMRLKREDFSAVRINWDSKAENIKQIAEELNIGLESIIFIDDNPIERELVKAFLPEVEVPDFPEQPYELLPFFSFLVEKYFSVYELTDEDKLKNSQYKANQQRDLAKSKFIDYSDYLKSLEIEIRIENANKFNIPRIAQLTQKTNQFNLKTKRYTEANIRKIISENNLVFCLNVKDKFGDSGITGVLILKRLSDAEIEIDTFLLSCRILAKDIEFAFLNEILSIQKQNGIRYVNAVYMPTNKNSQVSSFYEKAGFTLVDEELGMKKYKLDLNNITLKEISTLKIEKA